MNSRIYIESFHLTTSTGPGPNEFWQALCDGKTGVSEVGTSHWPKNIQTFWQDQPFAPIACKLNHSVQGHADQMSQTLSEIARICLPEQTQKLGLIFSSTKGSIEDHVWKKSDDSDLSVDPLYEVLEKTIQKISFNWTLTQVVSNSCASSHGAFALAKSWLQTGTCEKVLILAGDFIGPFVQSGFQTLKALSRARSLPFQSERSGLVLGEAMTGILLSHTESEFELVDVEIMNEAYTVTGPSPEGRGLQSCIQKMLKHDMAPDFVIAHGTATILNDQTEDHVLSEAQKWFKKDFYISGTKWSVGHTLGASGSVDVIAALMSLKNGLLFSLHGTSAAGNMKAQNYLMQKNLKEEFKTALITSLGFGGTNGAILIRKVS